MKRSEAHLPVAIGAVMALAVALLAGPPGTPGAAAANGHSAATATATATGISVDDAIQGSGQDQFAYHGSGWGHANGEVGPAFPYQGTNSYTEQTGDTVTFPFVGTALTVYGITAPQHGIGAVSVDGSTPTDINFYSADRTGNVALWTSPTLADGPHTLTLAWTGRKDPASSGTFLSLDRVSFNGQPPPPPTTDITFDPAGKGRVFDGVGAISGGGGNSRLLIDYPAKQRDQILDYLFKPGYGASLQVLKLEIGGDANSTDGAEPSVEHTRGVVNCNAGYEFWLAEQAKKRNPDIKLYGLAWTAPGWIGNGNFWSHDMVNYLMTWVGCAKTHGLTIDYLGGWNERGYNKAWYEDLHSTIAAKHLLIKVVGDDSGFGVADAMQADPKFAKSIDIVAAHYACAGGDGGNADSCSSTANAIATGKPLWDSENGSQDYNTGAPALIRAITRGYIDAKMTALLNWPLLAAITPNLPYSTVGLMVANQPWSGNYSVGTSAWITAQVTQFTRPGWQFLDGASGYLGGDRTNGSYVSLVSPSKKDGTVVVETTTATGPSTAHVTIRGNLNGRPLHVWSTDVTSAKDADHFVRQPDITPDGAGRFAVTLLPGRVYTFTTMTGGRGTAVSPAPHPLALPYSDNFNKYSPGQEARYLSDMQGAFEVQPCAAGRSGDCVQQMAPVKPIEWQSDSDAFALLGDTTWTDYRVQVDTELVKPGTVELIGRAGTQNRPQSSQQGYYFQISDTGAWTLLKSDANGNRQVLARASTTPLGTGTWHRLGLSFAGATITASVDHKNVGTVLDGSYQAGQIGLGMTSYNTNQFDNLSITPLRATAPGASLTVTPSSTSVQRGKDVSVTTVFTVPAGGGGTAQGVTLTLNAPAGFTYDSTPQVYGSVKPGQQVMGHWELTAPTGAASTATLTGTATYAQRGVATWLTATAPLQVTDPPAPTGVTAVSDLPFLSSTNGWGPVERDQSVGGTNRGDGQPLNINGTAYAKGLGTNSVSDVAVFLGGNCTSFTTDVGIDSEVGGSGTATFTVTGDGRTLATTPVLRGGQPAQHLTVDVTGVSTLHLTVGDGGDGNAYDHGDWASPTLHCAG